MTRTMTRPISKTEALKIARHLHSDIYLVSRDRGQKTYAYNVAISDKTYTTVQGMYRDLHKSRGESIRESAEAIQSGYAADWMSLDFNW